jgi:sec-independent protein translocase protein TatC
MAALPEGSKMIATGVITPFMVPMKVTALVAFMIALPYVLYQAWAFVAPGLYEHEKKLALPMIVAGSVLFLIGVAFCYYFVFGTVFRFINDFAPKSITPAPDIEAYFSFVITMFLAFGVTFEIPIVLIILVRAGVVSVEKLRDARPYFIVGAFVVAAIVTTAGRPVAAAARRADVSCSTKRGCFLRASSRSGEGASDYKPLNENEMERELDRADR